MIAKTVPDLRFLGTSLHIQLEFHSLCMITVSFTILTLRMRKIKLVRFYSEVKKLGSFRHYESNLGDGQ